MEQMQFCRQVLGFNKMAFDNTFSTVSMFQDQLETLLSSALQQNPGLPEDGRRALEEFVRSIKQGRDDYKKVVDESFEKFSSSC